MRFPSGRLFRFRSGRNVRRRRKNAMGGLPAGVWHPPSRLARFSRSRGKGTLLFHALWSAEKLRRAFRIRRCQGPARAAPDHRAIERSQRVNALKGAGSLRAARFTFTGETQGRVGNPGSRRNDMPGASTAKARRYCLPLVRWKVPEPHEGQDQLALPLRRVE